MATGLAAIRVLTVADPAVLRAGLRSMLAQDAGLVLVAEARNVVEAADVARETGPDVAIVDVREPGQINLRSCQGLQTQGLGS